MAAKIGHGVGQSPHHKGDTAAQFGFIKMWEPVPEVGGKTTHHVAIVSRKKQLQLGIGFGIGPSQNPDKTPTPLAAAEIQGRTDEGVHDIGNLTGFGLGFQRVETSEALLIQLIQAPPDHFKNQILLATEVIVDGCKIGVRRLRDIAQSGSPDALPGQQSFSRIDYFLTGILTDGVCS